MRAAILRENGPIERIEIGQIVAPVPTSDEILVRVHAASVNPADLKVVSGRDGGGFIHAKRFPTAIGFDFSGVVESVGSAAHGRTVGDEVFGHLAYSMKTRQGSFADLIAIRPGNTGLKPPDVRHEDAAASATVGCTALQALEKGGLRAGQRVLINGASGGVGSFAVQIARLLGAEVWATCSGAKAEFVESLGATEVIDYRQTSISEIDQTFDMVLDAASKSSFSAVKGLLTEAGAYVTLLPSASLFGDMATSLFSKKRCTFVTVQSRKTDLERLGAWIAAGDLNPSVQRTFPLEEITEALSALESGEVSGKIAVRVAADG